MRSVWLYRISAVLFVLFAAGHTFGFLTFRPSTAEGLAVLEQMNRVRFSVGGASFSYAKFYFGFGVYVTLYLLFSAYLAWHLSVLARRMPGAIGGLGWAFAGTQVLAFVLSWLHFGAAPAVSSGVLLVCLGLARFWLDKPGT